MRNGKADSHVHISLPDFCKNSLTDKKGGKGEALERKVFVMSVSFTREEKLLLQKIGSDRL